jgi:hypothetical protein
MVPSIEIDLNAKNAEALARRCLVMSRPRGGAVAAGASARAGRTPGGGQRAEHHGSP